MAAGKTPRPAPTSSSRRRAVAGPKRPRANAMRRATRPALSERSGGSAMHLLEPRAHARRAAVGGVDVVALVQRREVDRVAAEPVPAQAAAVVGTRSRLRRRQVEADVSPAGGAS